MYHEVTEQERVGKMRALTSSVVPRTAFAEQLEWLDHHAFTTRPVTAVTDVGSDPSVSQQVILTFDDGYIGNYDSAFPLLLEHNAVATFFVATALVGRPNMMSWAQIREMSNHGMCIGSHTVTHRMLGMLSRSEVARELTDSKKALEDQIGKPIEYLSLPHGSYNAYYRSVACEAHYLGGATSLPGINKPSTDAFFLRRMPIASHSTMAYFASLCERNPFVFARRAIRHGVTRTARWMIGESRYLSAYRAIRGMAVGDTTVARGAT